MADKVRPQRNPPKREGVQWSADLSADILLCGLALLFLRPTVSSPTSHCEPCVKHYAPALREALCASPA
ncbi:hypothetical protein RRG08_055386 [Elysia crispata]|uniref:Uncharacterized protein n=1 Tax=Elysia crispata TaxID=231223 RepID=A0AAE1AQQ7_9GAST|nr:hypothetical protein RRG08_055386 [Elysia crispata]